MNEEEWQWMANDPFLRTLPEESQAFVTTLDYEYVWVLDEFTEYVEGLAPGALTAQTVFLRMAENWWRTPNRQVFTDAQNPCPAYAALAEHFGDHDLAVKIVDRHEAWMKEMNADE